MAFIFKEESAYIRKNLKEKFPNIKFSVRIRHHMALEVAIIESDIDFSSILHDEEYVEINQYYLENYGEFENLFREILDVMMKPSPTKNWYNNSRSEIDYFDCAYYLDLSVGNYEHPYQRKEKKND